VCDDCGDWLGNVETERKRIEVAKGDVVILTKIRTDGFAEVLEKVVGDLVDEVQKLQPLADILNARGFRVESNDKPWAVRHYPGGFAISNGEILMYESSARNTIKHLTKDDE
jgi:hypothetical protein